jgi:predicted dehydrogenase
VTLRLGLAGLRHSHLEYLLAEVAGRNDVRIVAIAEDDPDIRSRFQQRLEVPAYERHDQMIAAEALDAVGVISMNSAKAGVTIDCLNAGLHVIVDKPLCTTSADLARIEAAWRSGNQHLSMLLDKRFYAPTLAAKALIDAGELGDIVLAWASGPHRLRRETRPDWMFEHRRYGGILNDLCIHDVDLLLWMTGATSGFVQGLAGNRANQDRPEFEDYGQLLLRLGESTLATCEAHWVSPEAAPYHGDYRMVITGTRGTAELRWVQNELLVATNERPPEVRPLPPAGSVAGDFFDAIIEQRAPLVDGPAVLSAAGIALLAQEHVNQGAWHPWTVVQPR